MSLVTKKVILNNRFTKEKEKEKRNEERIIINLATIPNIIETIQWYIRIKIFEPAIFSKLRNNQAVKCGEEISEFFINDLKKIIKLYDLIRLKNEIIQINIDKNDVEKCKKLEYSIKVFFVDLFNATNFDNICTNFSY